MIWTILSASWRAGGALRDPEGQRGTVLLFMAAGGVAMPGYAANAVWLVRDRPIYAFYLGSRPWCPSASC